MSSITRVLGSFAAATMSTMAVAGAHFVPEATDARWDGTVATVVFREVDVALDTDVTTISVKVTVDVDAVCTRGGSTASVHRSATALEAKDYPISDDGVVEGATSLPLAVTGVKGFTCVTTQVLVTAFLEDFWTGATLLTT